MGISTKHAEDHSTDAHHSHGPITFTGHCLALRPREHLLLQVPIKCNHKRGIWYLGDNSVECTDTGCITCLDKPKEKRTMTRCGAGGFGKHSGLSAESIWKSAFKVDVAGLSLAVGTLL